MHGIGEIREATSFLEATLKTLTMSMETEFTSLLGCKMHDGRPSLYLGFVECDDDTLQREVFTVGSIGVMSFTAPRPNCEPEDTMRYEIMPGIPDYEYPGTLVALVGRRMDDTRDIPDSIIPRMDMKTQPA